MSDNGWLTYKEMKEQEKELEEKKKAEKLLPCPICGEELIVYGPENWKPTLADSDSGGEPYSAVCDCGFGFYISTYDYKEFVSKVNTRKPLEKIVEQLKSEAERRQESGDEYNDKTEKGVACGFRYAIEIVQKGGAE